ncbi:MAG: OmpA family protein [Bacteroidia bacterium]|nr:OmpA family protein [Bacteroidia bacterium]
MKKYIIVPALALLTLQACVSKKVLMQSQRETAVLRQDSTDLANRNAVLRGNVSDLDRNIEILKANIQSLNNDIARLSNQNGQLGQQTANQQNQLSKTKEELQEQQQRLQQLLSLLERQRAQARELKDKMAEALKGFNSNDLTVIQKNGKVYVSLSENLLFPSGSAVVNPKGKDALSKLAAVLNLNTDISVDIEGHTDSIPIRGRYTDNWDLSTARANSIVRILVNNYKVDPVNVIASGHSYFDPVESNSTSEGRSKNRRTEIILSPKLEEMYRLIEG